MFPENIKLAKKIIQTIPYATVASVTPDGLPWNTPVEKFVDEKLHLYWFSARDSQHSKNITGNSVVHIVIYDSTVRPLSEHCRGVYIEAEASVVTNEEELKNVIVLSGGSVDVYKRYIEPSVRACYKAIPKRMWINDMEYSAWKFVKDFRSELSIDSLI